MVRVVKLGGSLLDLPDLPLRLQRLLETQPDEQRSLILVGGGKIVDAVRHYDQIHSMNPTQSHWLCVDLMHSTAQFLQALVQPLFPDWPLLMEPNELSSFVASEADSVIDAGVGSVGKYVAIVSPLSFYSRSLNAQALPVGWQTTSDSISAFLARNLRAEELILLKSTDRDELSQPLIDEAFHSVVPEWLKVRIVNLRAD